jgi:hypothetical protein
LWRLAFGRTGCDSDSPLFCSSVFTRTDNKRKELRVTNDRNQTILAQAAPVTCCAGARCFLHPLNCNTHCIGFVGCIRLCAPAFPANARELAQTVCAAYAIKLSCERLFLARKTAALATVLPVLVAT